MEQDNKLIRTENKNSPQLSSKNSDSNKLALALASTQLSKLRKENPQQAIVAISAMIENVFDHVKVGKRISAHIVIELAEDILEVYWRLKIDEIALALKNGRRGKYGKIYDRLDSPTIMGWIDAYDKSEEKVMRFESKASAFKGEENRGRNISVLEMPQFKEKVADVVDIKATQKKPSEAEQISSDDHKANVIKQAEYMMKKYPDLGQDEKT